MGILENAPVDFGNITGMKPVCIDNEKIRKRLNHSSNKIKVTSVPCILITRDDGSVEQYEGQTAFDWVNNIIQQNTPAPAPAPVPAPVSAPIVQQNVMTPEGDSESDDSIEYIPTKTRKKKKKRGPVKKEALKKTPVNDVISESDSDDSNTPKRPPVPIRSGAGGYDVSEDFGEQIEPNRNMSRLTNESGSQDANTKKSGDLMAQAMAMQKERESTGADNKSPFGS